MRDSHLREWITVLLLALSVSTLARAAEPAGGAQVVRREKLGDGTSVGLCQPVNVGRSQGYLWFPTLARMGDGRLLAIMNDYADIHVTRATCQFAWSRDQGLTWTKPEKASYGDISLLMPSGDLYLLPYYLNFKSDGLGAPLVVVKKGSDRLQDVEPGVSVTGWPKPVAPLKDLKESPSFVFNGQAVRVEGGYLATLYGHFKDEKFFSLVGAESSDGLHWKIRSVVADVSCGFKGSGPCESAMARIADGRLLCIFRNDGGLPYGQTFSSDDGRSWSKPILMKDVFSVQPSLVVQKDGTIVLSGGRPGIFLWINRDGKGTTWEKIDLVAHHNACVPGEPIDNTTAYTEVEPLDDTHLLVIYDRVANAWKPIPRDSVVRNSVWTMRIELPSAAKP